MRRRPPQFVRSTNANVCLAVVWVDGTRVRRTIKRQYEKLLQDMEQARKDLVRFENEDLPSFQRWFHSQFGALLSELREITQRIQELERLFIEIEMEMFFSGGSPGRAYARVSQRQANPEAFSEAGENSDQQNSNNRQGHSSDWERDFEDVKADFDGFDSRGGRRKLPDTGKHRSSAAAGNRLKDLYRALVRRLHPDTLKEMTPQKQEWWHQVQAAYEKGDIEQLEVILSLCEIDQAGTTEKTSLSVLQRICAQLKRSLRQIKSQLTKNRRDPAWNFQRRTDLNVLAKTMRLQMNRDLCLLKEQFASMELQKASMAAQARRRPARSRRRRSPESFDVFF